MSSQNCAICTLNADETVFGLSVCLCLLGISASLGLHKFRGISVLDEILLNTNALPRNFGLTIIIMGCCIFGCKGMEGFFQQIQPSVECWRLLLKKDLNLLTHKIKARYVASFKAWIAAHLN
ncbi:hypothetical protein CFC21_000766 [Triticum aestivum]|uniref:Uncharacterized protein n=1 Tax=Triticum aestivum TaxID=4565 RepID=A0A3B6UAY4_WHEAT|nr:hypothetical protein CFC21_000766 [Triticum aestivum]